MTDSSTSATTKTCFRCGAADAPLHHAYDISVGYFARFDEPRTCVPCGDALRALPDAQRAEAYAQFPTTAEPPTGTTDPIEDIKARFCSN